MKTAILAVVIWGFGVSAWGFPAQELTVSDKIEIAKERCSPKTADEDSLFSNDLKGFNISVEDLDLSYLEIYNNSKRLANRVGYYRGEQNFISKDTFTNTGKSVVFPESLIKAVTLQVENALRLDYVKYVFFPDMGHSHLFIPLDYYENDMSDISGGYLAALEVALKAPGLKLLYHTAEQLKMITEDKVVLSDRYIQWRFYTRNPVGDLEGNIEILGDYEQKSGHNTVRDLPGYKYYSGFNISANKDGCFPFQDKSGNIQYFDLSAWDLPYDFESGGDDDNFTRGNSEHSNTYRTPEISRF